MGADRALGRAVGIVALGSAVSRLTGFVRTVVLAAALGLGLVGDAYNTANVLPTIVYELLLGGVLSSIVVPLLVHASADGDRYAQRLLSLVTVGLAGATGLAVLGAPALIWAYGIRDDPAQVALTGLLARILLVEILFYGIGGMLGAILNSRGVFGPPAWAPALNNVVVIGTGLLFLAHRGHRVLTPDTVSRGEVWLLGTGTTLGIVAQAAVLVPALRGVGLRWRWRFDWRGAGLGEAGRLGLWVLADAVVSQIGYLVVTATANGAGRAGGLGSSGYANAWLLLQMPYGILGIALLTALLPRMSRAAAAGDMRGVVRDLSLGCRLTAVPLVPVTAALVVFGPAVATVVFARGQAGVEQARAVGVVLAVSAFGLLPIAVTTLQRQVFYALKDARTPLVINVAMVAVRVPACLACPLLLPPSLVVAGLAVANGASYVLGALVGQARLRRRCGRLDTGRVLGTVGRLVVATVPAAGLAGAVARVVGREHGALCVLAVGGTVGGLALVVGLLLARVPEAESLIARAGRSTRRDDTVELPLLPIACPDAHLAARHHGARPGRVPVRSHRPDSRAGRRR